MTIWALFSGWLSSTLPKTRNRTGIRNLLWQAMERGERVTLEQAIAILRRDW